MALYKQPYTEKTAAAIAALPHPTVQKFGVITVAVVGASRRFLAQITRHQNEVKFMSASLQYSNYSGQADLDRYEQICHSGVGHDSAGYAMPQGLRNVLIISATPYQWKHMISQRVCRRNTDETRIVLLKIWQELFLLSPILFPPTLTGPFCQRNICQEGHMTCGHTLSTDLTPEEILWMDYPAIMEGGTCENQAD